MRARIVIALLLLSFGTCAFAADKKVKQPPSSTGILISSGFNFGILGDGISTTFTINAWRIPQGTPLPFLPLVGVLTGSGSCGPYYDPILFTATVSGREVTITLASPPAAGSTYNCSATLLFQPE